MKKSCLFVLLLFFCSFQERLNSQTPVGLVATSGCGSSITATVTSSSNLWGSNMVLSQCDDEQGKCCKIIRNWSGFYRDIYGPPLQLQPSHYTLIESGGYVVAGPQSSPTFNNVPHGTYQIRAQVPVADFCEETGSFNVELYGYEDGENPGYYYVGRRGHKENRWSNWTIVGPTVQSDFYGVKLTSEKDNGWYPKTDFCPEDEVFLRDVSPNYNLYWIAIFENGGLNRWESTYWKNGTVHNNYTGPNFNLSALWSSNHPGWDFEEGLSYTVQFVIENTSCINSPQWNDKYLDFNIISCLADEPDDRSATQQNSSKQDIIIAPNPASSFLVVRNPNDVNDQSQRLVLQDAIGKTVMESDITAQPLDISQIPNGVYFAAIYQSGQRIFGKKLIIQH